MGCPQSHTPIQGHGPPQSHTPIQGHGLPPEPHPYTGSWAAPEPHPYTGSWAAPRATPLYRVMGRPRATPLYRVMGCPQSHTPIPGHGLPPEPHPYTGSWAAPRATPLYRVMGRPRATLTKFGCPVRNYLLKGRNTSTLIVLKETALHDVSWWSFSLLHCAKYNNDRILFLPMFLLYSLLRGQYFDIFLCTINCYFSSLYFPIFLVIFFKNMFATIKAEWPVPATPSTHCFFGFF